MPNTKNSNPLITRIFIYAGFPILALPSIPQVFFGDGIGQWATTFSVFILVAAIILYHRTRFNVLVICLILYFGIKLLFSDYYASFMLAPFFGVLAGSVIKKNLSYISGVILFGLMINGLLFLHEIINGQSFLWGGKSLETYKRGIFPYAKSTAEFLLAATLIFRTHGIILFLIFPQAFLSGVRAAWIGVLLIALAAKRSIFVYSSIVIFIIPIGSIIALSEPGGVSFELFGNTRWRSLLDPNSRTFSARFDFFVQHIKCIIDLPLLKMIFGSGSYCAITVGNGAENLFIAGLGYYGLLLMSLFIMAILFVLIKIVLIESYTRFLFPVLIFALVSFFWRFPLSFLTYSIIAAIYHNLTEKRFDILDDVLFQKKAG